MPSDKIPPIANSWNEWGKHVLLELERLNDNIEDMKRENSKINVDLALLKFKCSMFGALAGMIPVTILILIQWATTK